MGSTSSILLWWLQSRIKKGGGGMANQTQPKQGVSTVWVNYWKCLKSICFGKVHCAVISPLWQCSKGLKVWARIDLGRRLLPQCWRLIYWESATLLTVIARKLKESKLAGSFSEFFLLLLTLMRFSPYQSGVNNFRQVASVNHCLQNETNLGRQWGESGGKRVPSGGEGDESLG